MITHPRIRLKPGHHKRARAGHPWVYSNEIEMDGAAKALGPGSIVTLMASSGASLGTAMFNPHSLIAARRLAAEGDVAINTDFLRERLARALALRERFYPTPYYRLVHAEADGLPGLVIDRYGDVLTIQANSAGIDRLTPALLDALDALIGPRAVLLRNDSPVRGLEGLPLEIVVAKGSLDAPVELIENGCRFLADLNGGQKTGWFFDQRDNRAFIASLAPGRRLIEFYSYMGGFGIEAAAAGASAVIAVDRSEDALEAARIAATTNGVAERCAFVRAEAFAEMERRAAIGERHDIVVADPPAFIKSRRDLGPGAKGYRKLARLAAPLVAEGGILLLASCSQLISMEAFAAECAHGIHLAGRSGRILRSAGAGPDHPVHPFLPESAYLKALAYQLD